MTSKTTTILHSTFAQDILQGLRAQPKKLSSKYFYDKKGDVLFQQIMRMPEYYLTDCEYEILGKYKAEILELIGSQHFDLIELGAGDGLKTKLLLQHFVDQQADFTYRPIDISADVLEALEADIGVRWPNLDCQQMPGDYFAMLGELSRFSESKKVILFLGSNIGNLTPTEANDFIRKVQEHMAPGDLLITGFDLKKDPKVILNAYSDPAGITAAFNLNLLERINSELGGNFDVSQFKHWETYNPITGATKSYIVRKVKQSVHIKALNQDFEFDAWEAIDVELSQKFSLAEIEALAQATGFEVVQHFTDQRNYFVDSVWQKGE
ncbi:MAG: L-histidine N(alpha)-methyltransferase [Bacteroidota bacterium]